MKPITRDEVLPLGAYESIRDAFRTRIVAEKKLRRIGLGDRMTAVFENHDTALLQVQEMLRTERISREAAVLHEIETYNELVPKDGELSATFMIEIDDKAERERFLEAAAGIEGAVRLLVSTNGHTYETRGVYSKARESGVRASAVLYLKFPLPTEALAALKDAPVSSLSVSLEVRHAAYEASATLPPTLVASLKEDVS